MASCAICDNAALFRCGKCKAARYCSRECQKDHWPHHKTRCAQMAAESKAAAAAAAATATSAATPTPLAQTPSAGLDEHGAAAGDPYQHTQLDAGQGSSSPAVWVPEPPKRQPQPPAQPQPPSTVRGPSFRQGSNPRAARLLGGEGSSGPSGAQRPSVTQPFPANSSSSSSSGNSSNATPGSVSEAYVATHHSVTAERNGLDSGDVAVSDGQTFPKPPPASALPLAPRPPSALPQPRPPYAGHPPALLQHHPSLRVRLSRSQAASVPAVPGAPSSGGLQLQVEGSGLGSCSSSSSPGVQASAAAAAAAATAGTGAGSSSTSILDRVSPQESQQPANPSATAMSSDAQPAWPWARFLPTATAATTTATTAGGVNAVGVTSTAAGAATTPSLSSSLPPEVLLEVLKALPARSLAVAACVCRSWRRAAREPWLWVRQLCAAGYTLPPAAFVERTPQPPEGLSGSPGVVHGGGDGGGGGGGHDDSGETAAGLLAVAGVRGIRAVRAVRAAAGGASHEDFLGGLRAGFLDRTQHPPPHPHQHHPLMDTGTDAGNQLGPMPQQQRRQQHQQHQYSAAPAPAHAHGLTDLKALYGRTARSESNWRSCRYAEAALREHSSNVECLAFREAVEPWGPVLLSAAWDGSVRVFALGGDAAGGLPFSG